MNRQRELTYFSCIHRDIAARNCLIHNGIVKMADFGMCRATTVYKVDLTKPLNVRWLAPEVWANGETRFNTDVYAFGVMIWEFFITPYQSPYHEWKGYTVKVRRNGINHKESFRVLAKSSQWISYATAGRNATRNDNSSR